MKEYTEAVAKLFRRQGFDVESDTADRRLKGGLADCIATKDDTTFFIVCMPEARTDEEVVSKVEDAQDSYEDEDAKIIVFVSPEVEDRAVVEEMVGGKEEVDVSFFWPEEDDPTPRPDWMPSSYEIIGTVAVLNLDEEQWPLRERIAEQVQEQNPNVETVLAKTGQLSGEFRVGEYEVVTGDVTETVHTEHGCRYRVDPTEVYFSARLGFERQRVMRQVSEGEVVQVWFAGVGPYAVLIGREREPATVYAIEKNPAGCTYLRENVELNGVGDVVEVCCGDVRDHVPGLEKADRIVMPLPKSADAFLDLVFDAARPGCVVHYYRFSEEEQRWEKPLQEIREAADEAGREVEVLDREVCGHYAPFVDRVCLDVRID